MSYLGYIPQTDRLSEIHIATLGTNNIALTSLTYTPQYLDVYVNGQKIETTAYASGTPYYYVAVDETHVDVHACLAGDVIEFISYSTIYIAGGGSGGGGSVTPSSVTLALETIFIDEASAHSVNLVFDGGHF